MTRDLSRIFKAYDIRGTYPEEMDEDAAARIGWAFAAFVSSQSILVGSDMRLSSPSLKHAFFQGVWAQGKKAIDLGLISTDALYFASGRFQLPGVTFTASHNPANYNGAKLCLSGAAPVGEDTGLKDIRRLAEAADAIPQGLEGPLEQRDVLPEYAEHCRSFLDTTRLSPLKVAIDAGNGMAGRIVPLVFDGLPFELVPLYFELDGSFPNHPANPLERSNLADLSRIVLEEKCSLGVAFDGDADRMFLVDEQGEPVSGSDTTALVAERMLRKYPGAAVIYNLVCSRAVPEVIAELGGRPIRSRVGHSFIKQLMAETGAVFGGEHSGHYYFRDNYRADSGIIACLLALEAVSDSGLPLSRLLTRYRKYWHTGEINLVSQDPRGALVRLAEHYRDGELDWTDGLTVSYSDWWFNCRPSNTEPLLRLNLEANSRTLMERKQAEVLALIEAS